jgi:hypothetical protein
MVMSQGSFNPGHLLLFGKDKNLLEIRAMVLRSAGMSVDIVANIDDLRVRLASSGPYHDVFICCHSVPETERNEAITIVERNSMSWIQLEWLVSPTELIYEVCELLEKRNSEPNGA